VRRAGGAPHADATVAGTAVGQQQRDPHECPGELARIQVQSVPKCVRRMDRHHDDPAPPARGAFVSEGPARDRTFQLRRASLPSNTSGQARDQAIPSRRCGTLWQVPGNSGLMAAFQLACGVISTAVSIDRRGGDQGGFRRADPSPWLHAFSKARASDAARSQVAAA
jgi:hypothetical protein